MTRLGAILPLLLASCASLVAPGPDLVPVKSQPPGATVKVDGADVGKTPCLAVVQRRAPGVITFELEGYETLVLQRERVFNGWFAGNLFFGGLIGCFIDIAASNNRKHSTKELEVIFAKKGEGPSFLGPRKEPPVQVAETTEGDD